MAFAGIYHGDGLHGKPAAIPKERNGHKMKIKLALLAQDTNYLSRIVSVFTSRFSDKLEIYSFSDVDVALDNLKSAKIDVLVSSDSFDIDVSKIPPKCSFAYFVDSPNVETYHGQPTIFKFQKAEMIYKEVLDIFSENLADSTEIKYENESAVPVFTFVSPGGGSGSSTLAVACAKHCAMRGKKVLYLNFEQLGSSDSFFFAEGQFDFSDVIFAVKSKKANLALKLESNVKQDASGVYFYSAANTALDVRELMPDDIERMLEELKTMGMYDVIVIDTDFEINEKALKIFKGSSRVVFVSDGSDISNTKFLRAYRAFEIINEQSFDGILSKFSVAYNKFSNKTSKTIDEVNVPLLGGVPRIENATSEQIIQQILTLNVFNSLI